MTLATLAALLFSIAAVVFACASLWLAMQTHRRLDRQRDDAIKAAAEASCSLSVSALRSDRR